MPTYEIVQLIEVSYTVQAEDQDEAYEKAESMDWEVTPFNTVTGDMDAYPGGTILSFSEYPD